MLILNKKRILIIFMCIIVSLSFVGIKRENKAIETVALPVEDKVIILDARSRFSRCPEHQVMRE